MKPLISVIIVNYNTSHYVSECLKSLKENIPEVPCEVIIVDNNSDEDKIILKNIGKDNIKVFFKPINDGFGAGCNFGVSKSSADFILLLNPDIIFKGDIISEMFKFLNLSQNAGGCSPSFIYESGEQGYVYNKFPDLMWEFFEVIGRGYNFRLNRIENQITEYKRKRQPVKVDWITAACILLKKEVFLQVGEFDENYFLYFEDVDLQFRIQKAGKSMYCLPYLEAVHITNVSSKNKQDDSIYYYNIYKSRLIYINKHFNFFKIFLIRYLHITGLILRIFTVNFRNKYKNVKNIKSKQYRDILKMYLKNKYE